MFSEDMGAALAGAVNEWMARGMARPRSAAARLHPDHPRNAELAVDEIERRAADRRFVQVLMLVSGDMPLGRRINWPIYAAAERHGLPIGIHAGSAQHHAPTTIGWPSYCRGLCQPRAGLPDPAHQPDRRGRVQQIPGVSRGADRIRRLLAAAFLGTSPRSGAALRTEVPWVDRSPIEIVREQVRLTVQPLDAPPTDASFEPRARPDRLRRHAAVRDRLPALALRRRGCAARRASRRI